MPTGNFAKGFTLVELLLVLFLIGLLASIAMPNVSSSVQRAKEATLRENLLVTRKAIDGYYSDRGKYPESLDVLVDERYLRSLPLDPITEKTSSWVFEYDDSFSGGTGIIDIHSGANGQSLSGIAYSEI